MESISNPTQSYNMDEYAMCNTYQDHHRQSFSKSKLAVNIGHRNCDQLLNNAYSDHRISVELNVFRVFKRC